ncbi:hypothetical protein SGRIM128S_03515 [Streptomyces griseomycini]
MTDFPLTWLYAPGDRPAVVAKALVSGADVVVVDLEDAVAPGRKAYARAATAELLRDPQPVPVHVRVNALCGPWAEADLAAVAPAPGLSGLRLPKVSSASEVVRVARRALSAHGGVLPLYALLESALAVERAHAVAAAHPALRGIAIGETDLRAVLGVRDDAGLDWSRSRVVVAARAAGLAPPAQSVHPDIRDLEGLAASCDGRAVGLLEGLAGRAAEVLPHRERGPGALLADLDGGAVLAHRARGRHDRAGRVAPAVLARVGGDDADHRREPQDADHARAHDQAAAPLLRRLLLLALDRQPLPGGALSLTILLAHTPQNEPGRRTAPPRPQVHPYEGPV